ncbi:MAG: hypothetical protein P1S60_19215, partial [Anaerolineae bacterium]|nr:hypothetical protein [Anaerolineae bacterium]
MNHLSKVLAAILIVLAGLTSVAPVYAGVASVGELPATGSGSAIGFEDEASLDLVWPEPLEFVALNNTTLDLQVTMDVSAFMPEQPADA